MKDVGKVYGHFVYYLYGHMVNFVVILVYLSR
jgi:hypothetical protein